MQKIAQIILRAYLRRNPVHLRLSRFNYFTRYAWLKNVLADLRPELFPSKPGVEQETLFDIAPVDEAELTQLVHPLIGRVIRGSQGNYRVELFLGRRGNSLLFQGTRLESQQTVAIQHYQHSIQQDVLFEALVQQRRVEVWQRQGQFADQACLNLADGRSPSFRVPRPLDAIADEQAVLLGDRIVYSSFLVTEAPNTLPTLRQILPEQGALEPRLVRSLLSQLLQTLDFIHRHKFIFASGQIQPGLVHGNLNLDTVLWQVEHTEQVFLYLCDLRLWERLFSPLNQDALPSIQATPLAVQQDLQAVAEIGWAMLTGQVDGRDAIQDFEQDASQQGASQQRSPEQRSFEQSPEPFPWPGVDAHLEQWLQQLIHSAPEANSGGATDAIRLPTPVTAEIARQKLLQLPPLYERADTLDAATSQAPPPPQRRWSKVQLLGGLSALALLAALLWSLFPRNPEVAQGEEAPMGCCLSEVGAVPPGQFVYAAPEGGTWRYVTQQTNLMAKGQTLDDALFAAHPQIQLDYLPAFDPQDAMDLVRGGDADFAVIPAPEDLLEDIPPDMVAETIAYDGLAVVIPFSYADRRKGLPTALNGKLTLEKVQALYTEPLELWSELGGSRVSIRRFVPENPETQILFEQRVLKSVSLAGAEFDVEPLAPIPLLRSIIEGFEEGGVGPVAFSPLSQIRGQCSVYPLALGASGTVAVQPLLLADGKPISPETDLCDRKGAYYPDVSAFQTGRYPLSYPIVVLYLKDNRRSAVGQKFVDLMQTQEAQALLNDAGLVPLADLWRSQDP